MAFLEMLVKSAVITLVSVLFITFMPGLPPDAIISESFKITPSLLDGKLTPNNKLDGIEILFENKVFGPESFTDDNDFIYASQQTGEIIKFVGEKIFNVTIFGDGGESNTCEPENCGLPLALEFGSDGYLYVTDARYGIFKVDVKTGEKKKLVSKDQKVDGNVVRLPNSLAVACNGDIFWSDSFTDFTMDNFIYAFFANPSGRLIHYNAQTKVNKVLISGVHLANGVILSQNEDFVLVSELGRNRIVRYHLKGPKKGATDIFIDGLPGFPDNIQTDGGSGFLVSIIWEAHVGKPNIFQMFSQFPLIKKFVATSIALTELAFKAADKIYSNHFTQYGFHTLTGCLFPGGLTSNRQIILHVSENGEIIDSIWSTDISTSAFSEAHIVKDQLYLCSPFNNYIGRISLSKIGWGHLKQTMDSLTSVKQKCLNAAKRRH